MTGSPAPPTRCRAATTARRRPGGAGGEQLAMGRSEAHADDGDQATQHEHVHGRHHPERAAQLGRLAPVPQRSHLATGRSRRRCPEHA